MPMKSDDDSKGPKDVQHPAPQQKDVQHPALDQKDVQPPAVDQKDVQHPAPYQKDVQPPAPQQKDVQPPAPQQKDVQTPALDQQDVQPPAPQQKDVQHPTPEQRDLQHPAPQQKDVQHLTPHQKDVRDLTPHKPGRKRIRKVPGQSRKCKVPLCKYATRSDAALRCHMSTEHPKGRKCIMPFCKYAARSDPALQCHLSTKHPKIRKCHICDIMVPSLRQLKEHMNSAHADDRRFSCDRCSYVGTNSHSLQNHKTHVHDGVREINKLFCRERDGSDGSMVACTAAFKRVADLRSHLAEHHGMVAARDEINEKLETLDDFKHWKATFEEESSANYNSRDGRLKAGGTITYVCSRSGYYTPTVETRKRRFKSKGTSKLGFACTATMRAKMAADGRVSVTVYPFHYGHGTDGEDLAHLRLPTATRAYAQEKLQKGVSLSRIIRDVRQSREEAGDPSRSRSYRLTREDLLNIRPRALAAAASCSDRDETGNDMDAEDILSSEQQYLSSLRKERLVSSPEPDSPYETDAADPMELGSAPPSPQRPPVSRTVSGPAGKESGPRVIQKVRQVMLMARGREESISTSTCQGIMSHLAQIEHMLVQEGGSRTETTALREPSDAGSSAPRIVVHRPTPSVQPTIIVLPPTSNVQSTAKSRIVVLPTTPNVQSTAKSRSIVLPPTSNVQSTAKSRSIVLHPTSNVQSTAKSRSIVLPPTSNVQSTAKSRSIVLPPTPNVQSTVKPPIVHPPTSDVQPRAKPRIVVIRPTFNVQSTVESELGQPVAPPPPVKSVPDLVVGDAVDGKSELDLVVGDVGREETVATLQTSRTKNH